MTDNPYCTEDCKQAVQQVGCLMFSLGMILGALFMAVVFAIAASQQ